MERCAGIARRCDNSQPRPYRLVGINRPELGIIKPIRRLCDACRDSATGLGYEPEEVPEWLARGKGKDLSGALVA